MIRVRSWAGEQPLLGLDVTTGSWKVALDEAATRAAVAGWENVSVLFPGERAFKGDELRELVERARR